MKTDLLHPEYADEALEILNSVDGCRKNQLIGAADTLGVFEAITTPAAARRVADILSTDPQATEDLLIALVSMNLAVFRDGKFELTPFAREMLLPGSLRYIGPTLRLNRDLTRRFSDISTTIRSGQWPGRETSDEKEGLDWDDNFIRAMHGYSSNGGAGWLATRVDLSERRNLLDVGGGPGSYSIALCQRFSQLRATVWDLPGTLKIASEYIQRYGIADRVSLKSGNWNTDDFGSNYDALLMSNILHGENSQAAMKLEKAFQALNKGGLLIVQDFILRDDNSGPQAAALFRFSVGAYHRMEMLEVITRAGFKNAAIIDCVESRGNCLVTAVKN